MSDCEIIPCLGWRLRATWMAYVTTLWLGMVRFKFGSAAFLMRRFVDVSR
jgi:hypothetical protein